MKKRFLIIISFLLILTSCTNVALQGLISSIPEVQTFLKENPNSEIKTALLNQEYINKNIESIKKDCGSQMQGNMTYYYTTIKNGNLEIQIYTDGDGTKILCMIKPSENLDNSINNTLSSVNKTLECESGYQLGNDNKCYTCPEGFVFSPKDNSCHTQCGHTKGYYCEGNPDYERCINGLCKKCESGYTYGSDDFCHEQCGGAGYYCKEGEKCSNDRCVSSCDSGEIYGADKKCHPECGSGTYCVGTSKCFNGKCLYCASGWKLNLDDGKCYSTSPQQTTTTQTNNQQTTTQTNVQTCRVDTDCGSQWCTGAGNTCSTIPRLGGRTDWRGVQYYLNCGQCAGQGANIIYPDKSENSRNSCIYNYNVCVSNRCGRILDNCR